MNQRVVPCRFLGHVAGMSIGSTRPPCTIISAKTPYAISSAKTPYADTIHSRDERGKLEKSSFVSKKVVLFVRVLEPAAVSEADTHGVQSLSR